MKRRRWVAARGRWTNYRVPPFSGLETNYNRFWGYLWGGSGIEFSTTTSAAGSHSAPRGRGGLPALPAGLALERHAQKRVSELIEIERALLGGLRIVRRELERWANVAAGSPRKRGQWRSLHNATSTSLR